MPVKDDQRRFVVVTGLSGAGKSQVLRFLEDLGYYCVDNVPTQLIPMLGDLILTPNSPRKRLAVCVDARAGEDLLNLPAYLDGVMEQGLRPDVLFLDSANEVLIHRYSETRRRHPNAPEGDVKKGIQRERRLLDPIRGRADLLLDTSTTSVADLRKRIAEMFVGPREEAGMLITVMSFGFKRGVPPEADLVFDARFLPNPYYVEHLRPLTGDQPEVREYVMQSGDAGVFLDHVQKLLSFLVPRYEAEPKSYLTVAIGCTGGRHRSVTIARALAQYLRQEGHSVRTRHRDIGCPL
jgi:UPF0042 nucleotide-binding protein